MLLLEIMETYKAAEAVVVAEVVQGCTGHIMELTVRVIQNALAVIIIMGA